ncbi:MAG TPA: hypothetical protein DCL44_06385 [Elusimicrobia bacterium]|nr:hypothetical protein [Elusimicrobiota bacterium]
MKILAIAAMAVLSLNPVFASAAGVCDMKAAPELQAIDKTIISAAAGLVPAPVLTRVSAPEDLLPLSAVKGSSELIAAKDILLPANIYQIYIQDGELAVTAYRTKSFCRFLVAGVRPVNQVLKKGSRIRIRRVMHSDVYMEELDVQIAMDFLDFDNSNFYGMFCVGDNPVPNGSYLGAPKFVSEIKIGEMKKLLGGFFEFK